MPVLTSWSARTLAVSLALWAILVTAYVSLTFVRHSLLPSPYNTLVMVVLMMLTLVATGGILADRLRQWLDARLVEVETRIRVAADLRYARLHALSIAHDHRLSAMDAPTVPLPRTALVAVGRAAPPDETALPGYARGYVDGLARQPMAEDAKVIPLERSN